MEPVLKFRVWDSLLKQWRNSPQLVLRPDGKVTDGSISIEEPVQFFIDFKDKNGKEIYEGDLVEFIYANQPDIEDSKGVYEVFYSQKDSAYYLRVHTKNWLDTSFVTKQEAKAKTIDVNCPAQSLTELPLSQFKICSVIGNIFENPELLK